MDLVQIAVMTLPMVFGLGAMIIVLTLARRHRLAGRRSPLTQGLLRPAGHAIRESIDNLTSDLMGWVMGSMVAPLLLGGVLAGMIGSNRPISVATLVIYGVACVAVVAFCCYKAVRCLRELIRMRLGLDGELASGQELDQLMRSGAAVFHDLPAEGFNIDHVLVCPAGVYAVETKTRRKPDLPGRASAMVSFDGSRLNFLDWQETTVLAQSRRQATWLARELGKALAREIPVTPVISLPGWFVEKEGASEVWVLNPKNFKFLLQRAPVLSAAEVEQIAYQVERMCRDVMPAFSEPKAAARYSAR
jgi:hypothetical protein